MMDTLVPSSALSMSTSNGGNNMGACIYSHSTIHSSHGKSAEGMTLSDNDSETPISSPDEPSYKGMPSSVNVDVSQSPSGFKSEMMDASNSTY